MGEPTPLNWCRDTPPKVTGWARRGAYGLAVGTTGLIFGAIAIAWLAYLVPHFARRGEAEVGQVDDVDPANRFSDSVRILRRGTAPLLNQDLAEIGAYEVSTPMTRQAAVSDLRRLEAVAAQRRRRVLMVLLLVLAAMLVVFAAGLVPWWATLIPAGLLVAFVVVARVSVRFMHRDLDARFALIKAGSAEATVLLNRKDVVVRSSPVMTSPEPASKPGALWDPVPITMPTYVSKPLAPRTVRTIDLSGPEVVTSSRPAVPVTADAPTVERPAAVAVDSGGQTARSASA